jgi:putative ABC transport system permease protein
MILGIVPKALYSGIENYYVNGVKALGTNAMIIYTGNTPNFLDINQIYGISFSDISHIDKNITGIKYLTPFIQFASYIPSNNLDVVTLGVNSSYGNIINTGLLNGSYWSSNYNYSVNGTLTKIGSNLNTTFGKNETVYETGIIPCIIGYGIYKDMNASVGQIIYSFSFAPPSIGGIMEVRLKVAGIQQYRNIPPIISSFGFDINSMITIPLLSTVTMFNTDYHVYGIIASSSNFQNSTAIGNSIVSILTKSHPDITYTIMTQEGVINTIDNEVNASVAFNLILNALSFFIAALIIFVLTIIAVKERMKEIGILKATGATKYDILMIFLSEQMLITVAGIVIGTLSGFLLLHVISTSSSIYPVPYYPTFSLSYFRYTDIASLVPFTIYYGVTLFIISLISAFYPSYKASCQEVVDSLHSD